MSNLQSFVLLYTLPTTHDTPFVFEITSISSGTLSVVLLAIAATTTSGNTVGSIISILSSSLTFGALFDSDGRFCFCCGDVLVVFVFGGLFLSRLGGGGVSPRLCVSSLFFCGCLSFCESVLRSTDCAAFGSLINCISTVSSSTVTFGVTTCSTNCSATFFISSLMIWIISFGSTMFINPLTAFHMTGSLKALV